VGTGLTGTAIWRSGKSEEIGGRAVLVILSKEGRVCEAKVKCLGEVLKQMERRHM